MRTDSVLGHGRAGHERRKIVLVAGEREGTVERGVLFTGETTLDEVFVRVVREYGGREENSHMEEKKKLWSRRW